MIVFDVMEASISYSEMPDSSSSINEFIDWFYDVLSYVSSGIDSHYDMNLYLGDMIDALTVVEDKLYAGAGDVDLSGFEQCILDLNGYIELWGYGDSALLATYYDKSNSVLEIIANGVNASPSPTEQPTEIPTEEPTEQPTEEPTEQPTETPTGEIVGYTEYEQTMMDGMSFISTSFVILFCCIAFIGIYKFFKIFF